MIKCYQHIPEVVDGKIVLLAPEYDVIVQVGKLEKIYDGLREVEQNG